MNSPTPLNLVGTWSYKALDTVPEHQGVFHITKDFIYVSIQKYSDMISKNNPEGLLPQRYKLHFESNDMFQMIQPKKSQGPIHYFSFSGSELLLRRESDQMRWSCRQIDQSQAPPWFFPMLDRVLSKPWPNAEQDAAANP